MDPLDAAATAQHPTVAPASRGSRRVVRRKPSGSIPASRSGAREMRGIRDAGSTSEVAVEDILLEVYAEEPPPPPSRRVKPAASPMPSDFPSSIRMAIGSVLPPPPSQSAAVDALLRASDPAFAAPTYAAPTYAPPTYAPPRVPAQGQGFVHPQSSSFPAVGYHVADYDSPSVAPVMLATPPPPAPLARPIIGTVHTRHTRHTNRGAVLAIWAVVILVVGIGSGAALVLGVSGETFAGVSARVRNRAKSAAGRGSPAPPVVASPVVASPVVASPVVASPVVASPPPAPQAPPPAPQAASISVDALPPTGRPEIGADVALVTFPPYAQGHRVFVDGRIVTVADGSPTKIKCGRHMIKIGSARRPRVVDLACGREVSIH